jgi:putative ABC transport system permease protein
VLRLQLRDLAGHPLRTAGVVALVAVCSALVVAVAGLVISISTSAEHLRDQVAGTADVEVAAAFSDAVVPEPTIAAVEQVDGVGTVAPVVEAPVAVEGERAVLLAGDQRAVAFLPDELAGALAGDEAVRVAAGRPLLSAALASALGVGAGDTVAVRGQAAVDEVTVGGVLPAGAASGHVVVADLATGQRLRGGSGFDRLLVDLVSPAGAGAGDASDTMRAVRAAVAGRAVLVDPEGRAANTVDAFQPVIQPLLMLAAVTVVVAAVLVFNVVGVSVAERRRHLAIQAALGARRRKLWRRLVGEAAVLGAIGGALGMPIGRQVTAALVERVPSALADAALHSRITVDVPGWLLLVGVAVGAGAAAMAAAAAGRPVLRLSPLEAMGPRDVIGETSVGVSVVSTALGLACLVVGTATVAVAPEVMLAAGALLILIGVVALVWGWRGPVAQVVATVARRAGAPGLLAALAVGRSPARNATTVLGALLPVAAFVSLGGLQANLYDTARRSYAPLGEADLYVSAQPLSDVGDRSLPADMAGELEGIDGVSTVLRSRFTFVRIGGTDALVDALEPEVNTAPLLRLASPDARRRVFEDDAAVISRALATRLGVGAGDRFTLPTAAGTARVEVADVVDVTGWPGGYLAMSYDRLAAWSGVDVPNLVEVHVDGPGAARAVRATIERHNERTGDSVVVTGGDAAVHDALTAIRQSRALFTALQVVLLLAGAFAIVSTLVITTIGRTRELGLLRAVGAQRRLVRRSVVVEAFVVTLGGAAVGVGVGTVLQYIGVRLAARSAGFAADFALTPSPSLTALVGGVAIAAAAAVVTLRRILRLDVLDAIAYE